MNYSDKPYQVRVDFFKPSGKWYETECMVWSGESSADCNIVEEFKHSLQEHLEGRMKGMYAVCLDPYHENSYPLMVEVE